MGVRRFDDLTIVKLAAYYARCAPGLADAPAQRMARAVVGKDVPGEDVRRIISFALQDPRPAKYFVVAAKDVADDRGCR